jgi:hypothetical protein
MTASTEVAVLITDPQEAAAFADEVATLTGEQPLIADRRGIDGATTAGLLVVVTTAIQTLPAILNSVTRLLQRNAVGEIEMTDDGIRITNPRRQDIDDLRARYTGDGREGVPDAR